MCVRRGRKGVSRPLRAGPQSAGPQSRPPILPSRPWSLSLGTSVVSQSAERSVSAVMVSVTVSVAVSVAVSVTARQAVGHVQGAGASGGGSVRGQPRPGQCGLGWALTLSRAVFLGSFQPSTLRFLVHETEVLMPASWECFAVDTVSRAFCSF